MAVVRLAQCQSGIFVPEGGLARVDARLHGSLKTVLSNGDPHPSFRTEARDRPGAEATVGSIDRFYV
jgi:hypothetical protein